MYWLKLLLIAGLLFISGCVATNQESTTPITSAKVIPLVNTVTASQRPHLSTNTATPLVAIKPSPTLKTSARPTIKATTKAAATLVPAIDTTSGATAKCYDGTLSYSAHRQGTCSHHGGVDIWY